MPVHIERIVSDVTVVAGDLPLSKAQLDKIAEYVIACLDRRNHDRGQAEAATAIRPVSEPAMPGERTD